jgi:hypothetical protein
MVKAAPYVAHVYLMNYPAFAEVLHNQQYFLGRILQARSCISDIQLETVIRRVDDRFLALAAGLNHPERYPG